MLKTSDPLTTTTDCDALDQTGRYRYVGKFVLPIGVDRFALSSSGVAIQTAHETMGADHGSMYDAAPYGPSLYEKASPVRRPADMGVFIAELRDFPRMLRTTAKLFNLSWLRDIVNPRKSPFISAFGTAGDQWLNLNFGWRPFINDLAHAYDLVNTAESRLAQLKRDEGKWVRRRRSERARASERLLAEDEHNTLLYPLLPTTFYGSSSHTGTYQISERVYERAWFEGVFKYRLPRLHGKPEYTRRLHLNWLWGTLPTPSAVWEATPWSWLIDWFSSVGDSISNAEMIYLFGQTTKYAFVMKTTEVTGAVYTTHDLHSGSIGCTAEYPVTWKHRTGASPFGLYLDDSIGSYQWSILGALGLTRFKRPSHG